MDHANTSLFLDEVAGRLGPDAVDRSEAERAAAGHHTLPGPDLPPPAILYPASTAEVQAIVKLANIHRVPLFPISTGWNRGIGSRAPMEPGQVVMALGKRMNKVIEVNDELSYAVVEPGVSFNMMHDELGRRGSKLMMSPTAGPPDGSILGNAIDKGGGAGPLANHFENVCGMEVVLGNGDIIRTGDGGIDSSEHPNWHVTKYSFGPALDGIFTQSNYGIVTRAGIWMNLKKVYHLYREERRRASARRAQAGARHKGTGGHPAGSEPALEPRLRVGCPERRPALPGTEHRRRLHPRMPGGGRRYLVLRRPRGTRTP